MDVKKLAIRAGQSRSSNDWAEGWNMGKPMGGAGLE
jgi:hypothetical protein